MNKLVLALLVTTLAFAPSAPAQSCSLAAYSSCSGLFPGGDWLVLTLRGYCDIAEFFLCGLGL